MNDTDKHVIWYKYWSFDIWDIPNTYLQINIYLSTTLHYNTQQIHSTWASFVHSGMVPTIGSRISFLSFCCASHKWYLFLYEYKPNSTGKIFMAIWSTYEYIHNHVNTWSWNLVIPFTNYKNKYTFLLWFDQILIQLRLIYTGNIKVLFRY